MSLLIEYDREADAIYVRLISDVESPTARTVDLDGDGGRMIDYDASGAPVGVELLDVSAGVSLEGLPHAEEIRAALAGLREISIAAA